MSNFEKTLTEQQRATIAAAFAIIHDSMIDAGEEVIMLTSEIDTPPGEPRRILISHFVRGDAAQQMVDQGFITEAPLQ